MSVLQACPRCGAVVRPDASWCPLCHQPFGSDAPAPSRSEPAPAPAPEPSEAATAGAVAAIPLDPLNAPLEQLLEPAEPPSPQPPAAAPPAVPAPQPVPEATESHELPAGDRPAEDVDVMLALLAAEHQQQDALGPLAGRLQDKGTRAAVMLGGVVLLSLVLFGVLGVLSLLA